MRHFGFTLLLLAPLAMLGCQHTGALSDTTWSAVEVMNTGDPGLQNLDLSFGDDGWVEAVVAWNTGEVETSRRRYSVHRSLLIVERPDGDLELLHQFHDGDLVLTDENFQARLRRTN